MRLGILLFCTILLSSTLTKGAKVSGKITDFSNSYKYIYLYDMLGTESMKIDSAEVKNGLFSFKGKFERGFYRMGLNSKQFFILVMGDESFEIKTQEKDMSNINTTISDSKENDLFIEFNKFNQGYASDIKTIQTDVNKARSMNGQNPALAQKMFRQVQQNYDSISNHRLGFYNNFIKQNSGTYMHKIASLYLRSDTLPQKGFFEINEVEDKELQRGDMIVALTSTYFQKYLINKKLDYLTVSKNIIENKPENSTTRELLYISFIRNLLQIDGKVAAQLGKQYKKEYPNSIYQKGLTKGLPALPLGIGDEAPDISQKNPDGKLMKLSDTRGKVVLLDFWASWCGPCRRENPNVVKAYNKFKDKGFTVFSVSLDKNKQKWLGAIQRDGLVWPTHVSDLKGWSAAPAKKYGVRGIPATYLLDKNGIIIGQNLRGLSLEQKLKEVLE